VGLEEESGGDRTAMLPCETQAQQVQAGDVRARERPGNPAVESVDAGGEVIGTRRDSTGDRGD